MKTILIVLATAYLTIALLGQVLEAVEKAQAKRIPEASVQEDWRPDIRHCFDDDEKRELWDCIRFEGEVPEELRKKMRREDL